MITKAVFPVAGSAHDFTSHKGCAEGVDTNY